MTVYKLASWQVHKSKNKGRLKLFVLLVMMGFAVLTSGAQPASELIPLPPITITQLDNGLKVILIEQPRLPMAHFEMWIRAGSAYDPSGKAGLAAFVARMLTQGTEKRTAEQIADMIDFIGGELSTRAEVDRSVITLRVLKKDFQKGLDLLADIVQHPNFHQGEIPLVRRQLGSSVRRTQDVPQALMMEHLKFALFGEAHPLGNIMNLKALRAMSRYDLVNFYQAYYHPNNAILAIAGDVKPNDILNKIKNAFGGWAKAEIPQIELRETSMKGYKVRFVHKADQTQLQIGLGHFGVAVPDPDYLPVLLANYVLGGGVFSSRLLTAVRSQVGKTYHIESRFLSYLFPGYFQIWTFTRNEQALSTLQLVLEEFKRFKAGGITPEELKAAQDNIAGSYILRLETLAGLTATVLSAEFYGFGLERIRNFRNLVRSYTLDQVNEVIRKRFDPENLVIVLLGDKKVLEGRKELIPGVTLEKIGFVDWRDPVMSEAIPYSEFK